MASENRNVRGSRDGSGRDYGNRDRANNRDQDSRDGSSRQTTRRRKGKCKWFNVVKGWGFITPDDGGQEVFVHQHVIHMEGFRSLAENENVEFECEETPKGFEATVVTGPSGTQCVGSQRAITRKRSRKIRCYNCGEYGNHIAAKCKMGPMPKRCHHCKSEDHLIADCPQRFNKNSVPVSHDENGEEDDMEQQLKSRMASLSVADKK